MLEEFVVGDNGNSFTIQIQYPYLNGTFELLVNEYLLVRRLFANLRTVSRLFRIFIAT